MIDELTDEDINFICRALAERKEKLDNLAQVMTTDEARAAIVRGAERHQELRSAFKLGFLPAASPGGSGLIAQERQRQREAKGWTPEHDAHHVNGELGWAAAHYAAPGPVVHEENGEPVFPFDDEFNNKPKHDRVRQLTIAGAFCAAEIDRLNLANK